MNNNLINDNMLYDNILILTNLDNIITINFKGKKFNNCITLPFHWVNHHINFCCDCKSLYDRIFLKNNEVWYLKKPLSNKWEILDFYSYNDFKILELNSLIFNELNIITLNDTINNDIITKLGNIKKTIYDDSNASNEKRNKLIDTIFNDNKYTYFLPVNNFEFLKNDYYELKFIDSDINFNDNEIQLKLNMYNSDLSNFLNYLNS